MAPDPSSSDDLPPVASHTPAKSTTTSTESIDTGDTSSLQPLDERPKIGSRLPSATMIVPHDHPEIELKNETYGPNDARSFSPRRGVEDTERMMGGKRSLLKGHADELQNGLNAIVEKVESVKSDHDKLERNNTALQDYIGGLTQSMSKTNLASGASGRGGRTEAQRQHQANAGQSKDKQTKQEQQQPPTPLSSSPPPPISSSTKPNQAPKPNECTLCEILMPLPRRTNTAPR